MIGEAYPGEFEAVEQHSQMSVINSVRHREQEEAQDRAFLIEILFKIRDYARENDMDEDDTIRTISNNMLQLLEIATFRKTD